MASHTDTTVKNSFYSIAGYIAPALFSLILTPILVAKLGIKDYGLMAFIGAALGILGLLDFGIKTAISKKITHLHAIRESTTLSKTIATANSLFLIAASIGACAIGIAYTIARFAFPEKLAAAPEIGTLAFLATASFFINTMSTVALMIPNALQRFDISTKYNIALLFASNIASISIVLSGKGLVGLYALQATVAILTFILMQRISIGLLPESRYRIGWSRQIALESVSFGGYAAFNEFARTSLFSLDRLLIPIFLGPASLTYYTIPGNMAARIPGVSDNLSGVIFPVSAHLHSQNDLERTKTLYLKSTRLLSIISAAIGAAIIFNGYEILKYWISPAIADASYSVLVILVLTNFILSFMSPIATFLMVFGKWKLYTTVSIIMAAINAIAIFALMPHFGLIGAAWAYLISVLPIFYAIYHLETKHLHLPNPAARYARLFASIALAAAVFFIFNHFIIHPYITNLASLVILGPISVLSFFIIFWLLGLFDADEKTLFANTARKMLAKIKPHQK